MRAAFVRLSISLTLMVSAASLAPLATASADPSDPPPSTATPTPATPAPATPAPATPTPATPKATQATPGATSTATPKSSETGSGATSSVQRAAGPTTRLYRHPREVTIYGKARFSYASDRAGVVFRCRLRGPDHRRTTFHTCPSDAPGSRSGRGTYTGLKASRGTYRFTVQAFLPATATRGAVAGRAVRFHWRIWSVYRLAPHYVPHRGATFNRPLSPAHQLTNINKMINTINAMPGYKQGTRSTCPWAPRLRPASIRVTLYSLTGKRFTTALIAAHRRCISVQVLMNNHLDRNTDPAWRRLEDALGTKVYGGGRARRSFAHRCSYGCRGSGVLHTKMYLFDSSVQGRHFNRINSTVSTGSANMTFNATNIQYNDLFTVRSRPDLYRTFLHVFNLMKRDRGVAHRLIQVRNGSFQSTFWPQDPGGPDPQMQMLRSIHCKGARGGTGYRHRTVVYINMHAWFNTRGMRFARQVRLMHQQGCYIRVLYGFMSFGVFKQLYRGKVPRITVRRTLFSRDGHTGYVYSHMKNVAVSGHVGSDHSARVVWTGSNNFTNGGTHYDEVMLRIPFASAYNRYRRQFRYISRRLSSARYAIFQEPQGGGRAPRMFAPRALDVPADEANDLPPGTPVITSPAIRFNRFGEPRAVD